MITRFDVSRLIRVSAVAIACSLLAASQAVAGPPPVPEIDPGSAGSVVAVLFAAVGLLERRRK